MKIPKGIEGDYIETKNESLFFDVKGVHHPSDRKICFIRFYPHLDGDRIKNGKKFKKIYDLQERFYFLRNNYPNYLFFSKQFDLELQGVKNEDIKEIYTPREYYKELSQKSSPKRLEKCSKELCELFIENSSLPHGSIGITGSQMVGLSKNQSDIDLIIYGTDISRNFQNKLANILEKNQYCRKYTSEEYHAHYEWRVGSSGVPFESFLKSERRKLHQGKYKGFDFFIRYIQSPKDWKGAYYDYSYKNMGRIKLKAKITDDSKAIFTPCSYEIEGIKAYNNICLSKNIELDDIIMVNSLRGRFCEHAIKGETVLIEGKLEKVIFRNEEYFRILLTDQKIDKMMILE
ncbi:MAG: hypothetical protein ACFE8M_05275 [Candidatus Hermodarchaeota archaeon]